MELVRLFPYEDVSTTSGRKPIADATNCTRTHSTALSRAARLLSRARPLTSTLVAGAQQKERQKERERKKNKNENEEGLEPGSRFQQGFASISDVVIDLGAVKA